jgi:hypothetical protein
LDGRIRILLGISSTSRVVIIVLSYIRLVSLKLSSFNALLHGARVVLELDYSIILALFEPEELVEVRERLLELFLVHFET